MLVLLAVSCATKQESLEQVYHEGYRELEWGNLEVARAVSLQGLRQAQEEQRPFWVRAFAVLDAEVLVAQRRIEEALDRLSSYLEDGGPVDILRARALMTRGYARCFLPDSEGAISTAEIDLRDATDIAMTFGVEKVVAEVALRRGKCSHRNNDLDAAEADFRAAMATARRRGFSLIEAQAAGSLGWLRVGASQFDDAVRWLRLSLELVADLPADGLRLKSLGNLGWCYLLLGDYQRATAVLSEAETLARQRGYSGDRVIALTNLGHGYRGQARYVAAQESYRRATAVAREIQNRSDAAELLAYIHATRAALALEQGHLDEAAAQVEEALRIRAKHGDDVAWQRTRLLQGEIWARHADWSRAATRYEDVIASSHSGPDLRWEARAALARLHVQADRPREAEMEFQRAFALMETSLSRLLEPELQLPFFSNLRRFYNDYVSFLLAQGNVLEALEVADHSRARLLRERLRGADGELGGDPEYPRLARDLGAVLLFYWTAPERSFLWTVTADGVELTSLPEREVLDALVARYRKRILESRDPVGERDLEGAELYRALVQPASAAVAAADRVFIVPDGPLHQLNFESLIVSEPEPHYWIEDAIVVRAPSLRLLRAESESPPRTEPSLLVLGDPAPPDEFFPRLPFAGREATSIVEWFAPGSRQIYAGPRAVPSAYRGADPGRFSHIHFAAHAQANSVVPLESAVVLSADDDGEYKLYARDIVSIPLDAELVTLSACRSAGGRTFAGEGLVGLSWAFLSAGARHVIGGLWQVEDASTATLMEHLYRELVDGAEPAVALRRAKLDLLRSGTAYRKPYYWAPFVTYASRSGRDARSSDGSARSE